MAKNLLKTLGLIAALFVIGYAVFTWRGVMR
jgi:hypothetical protein